MEINIITEALGKLEKALLYRTPKNLKDIAATWFEQFQHMPEDQFLSAVDEIVKLETVWPAIAIIYRYASNWQSDETKKKCSCCEDDGLLLIKSKGVNVAYACKCPAGRLRQANLKIASYESLGVPWPKIDDKPVRKSDKMTADNRKKIDEFLERIGGEIENARN